MERIDTHNVESAFADLMEELKKIKNLNEISDKYKETAATLVSSLGGIVQDVKSSNQEVVSRFKDVASDSALLLEKAEEKLAVQVEPYIKGLNQIEEKIQAITESNLEISNISQTSHDLLQQISGDTIAEKEVLDQKLEKIQLSAVAVGDMLASTESDVKESLQMLAVLQKLIQQSDKSRIVESQSLDRHLEKIQSSAVAVGDMLAATRSDVKESLQMLATLQRLIQQSDKSRTAEIEVLKKELSSIEKSFANEIKTLRKELSSTENTLAVDIKKKTAQVIEELSKSWRFFTIFSVANVVLLITVLILSIVL